MACQPSSTFLLVASSTSKGGTICPPGIASILIPPWVSLSTRSANILKCSCSVLLAGQVDCILIAFTAGAGAAVCAAASRLNPAVNANATAAAIELLLMTSPCLAGTQDARPGALRVSMIHVGSGTSAHNRCVVLRCAPFRRTPMANKQQRGNREKKKPKQPKKPAGPATP